MSDGQTPWGQQPDQPPPGGGGFGPPPGPGFGPPQQPPQPPAGPPPAAGGTPGYGPPQPPTGPAPGGAPGYGHPQAPAGYGYPQAPAGWGAPPQQPGAPAGPGRNPDGPATGGPGGGRPRRGRLYALIGGVVALAVLVTGGVVLFTGDDGKPEAKPSAKPAYFTGARHQLWSKPALTHNDPSLPFTKQPESLLGTWRTSKTVVRGDELGATAYDLRGGGVKWNADKPAGDSRPCAMGSHLNSAGTLGALMFQAGEKGDCKTLELVDASTGRQKWHTDVASGIRHANYIELYVGAKTVVAITDVGVFGYSLDGGHRVWSHKGKGPSCTFMGTGKGSSLVVLQDCPTDKPRQRVVEFNPDTGDQRWSTPMGHGEGKMGYVLSADPVVVRRAVPNLHDGTLSAGTITAYDHHGKLTATIKGQTPNGNLMADNGDPFVQQTVFFHGSLMVTGLGTDKWDAATRTRLNTETIVAYDLKTGKLAWKRPTSSDYDVRLVGTDGDDLVGVGYTALSDKPAKVLRYSLKHRGKPASGGTLPNSTTRTAFSGDVLIDRDLLLVAPMLPLPDTGRVVAYGRKG